MDTVETQTCMQHRDVDIALTELEPGVWRFSFKIDGKTIVGTTQTKLRLLAVRRAKDRVNRELRNGDGGPS